MRPRLQVFFIVTSSVGILFILFLAMIFTSPKITARNEPLPEIATRSQSASASEPVNATSSEPAPKTPSPTTTSTQVAAKKPKKQATSASPPVEAASSTEIHRIENPYEVAPESFDNVNAFARAALVNIFCMPREGGSLNPISASGVIIDPRGVILTNAHVAQYVLLSEDPQINLSCTIRTGSPASPHWIATIFYIPPIWVREHAKDLNVSHPMGTGERDYALLLITKALDGTSPTASFPYVAVDTRNAIGFLNDPVLAASYPAEFVGGIEASRNLYPVSSVTAVKQMLTFASGDVDVISIGGVIEAQGGSSGGAVVNAWQRLIGIITTTSEGVTTADRDLHALTLYYINSDLKNETGSGLSDFLAADLRAKLENFRTQHVPELLRLFVQQLSR